MRKILIDARMVQSIPHGIARYVGLMAKGLRRRADSLGLPYEPVFLVSQDFPQSESKINSRNPDFYGFPSIRVKAPFLNPRELLEIPSLLRQVDAAVYHSPSFSGLWNIPCPGL